MKQAISSELILLVKSHLEKPKDPDTLEALYQKILLGEGSAVFQALLGEGERATLIAPMMRRIEAMAALHPGVAGYLMGRLYPLASKHKDHETFDAVALWMAQSATSPRWREALVLLSGLRRRYQGWAGV